MFRKEIITTYHLDCKCGNSISLSEKEWKSDSCSNYKTIKGWKIEMNIATYKDNFKESCSSVICPVCIERKRLADLESDDMLTRLQAGYYKNVRIYGEFFIDLFKEYNIDYNHPKRDTIISMLNDCNSHIDKYYKMEEIVKLIK